MITTPPKDAAPKGRAPKRHSTETTVFVYCYFIIVHQHFCVHRHDTLFVFAYIVMNVILLPCFCQVHLCGILWLFFYCLLIRNALELSSYDRRWHHFTKIYFRISSQTVKCWYNIPGRMDGCQLGGVYLHYSQHAINTISLIFNSESHLKLSTVDIKYPAVWMSAS